MADPATLLSRTTATLSDLQASASLYYGYFDKDDTTDVSRKVRLDNIVSLAEHRVANIAALRALTVPLPLVWVAGHTTEFDGGEGLFRYVGSGANAADIDSSGDDDNGWHIVNAGGHIWARVSGVNTPQQWGAISYPTVATCEAGADMSAKLQRWLNFWSNPVGFGGWEFRTDKTTFSCVESVAPDGLYKITSTVTIYYKAPLTNPYAQNRMQAPLTFLGALHVPAANQIPAVKITDDNTNGGCSPLVVRVNKGRTSGKATWTTYDYPKLYENDTTYRAYANGKKVYKRERIKVLRGDGSTYLYRVEVGGTLGASAPSHTSGNATNGTATLKALGTVRNQQGKLKNEFLVDVPDYGVWVDALHEHHAVTIYAEGFMVGVACIPKETSGSSIGWVHFHCPLILGCHVGALAASYQGHRQVNNQTERLALTNLPVGARVAQLSDTTDYVFNGPAGQESNSANWSASGYYSSSPNWCNENYYYLTSVVPNRNTAVNTTDSAYGYVGTCFGGEISGHPVTHNIIPALSFEFSNQTTDANESYQAVLYNASEHYIHARNDSSLLTGILKTSCHVSLICESNKNYAEVARSGESTSQETWFRDYTNGRGNVARERQMMSYVSSAIEVDFSRDVTFSGYDKMFLKSLSGWHYQDAAPKNFVYYDTSGDAIHDNRFNADDMSFDFGLNSPVGVMVDLRKNHTGFALVQCDVAFSHNAAASPAQGFRMVAYALDETGVVIDINSTDFPRCPIATMHAGIIPLTRHTFGGRTRAYNGSYLTEKRAYGFEPWVAFAFVGIAGYRFTGVRFQVLNCDNAQMWSPAHKNECLAPHLTVEAAPQRGVYRSPCVLHLAAYDGSNNTRLRLNKPNDGNTYWGVSGQHGVDTPVATQKQWFYSGAQGSATIYEYDGVSAYTPIATNARYALASDWVAIP